MRTLHHDDPIAVALVTAIRAGEVPSLQHLLSEHPGVAVGRIQDKKGGLRTLLHVATDWPGHFPSGAAVVRLLIRSGANPNARMEGSWHTETPLHWAASSDDVEVIDALLDGGAQIEAAGASIADGTALDDAVGYGQFNAARRLVEHGACTKLWHAAALGLLPRVQDYFASATPPSQKEVTEAFWQACHGGQHATAEFLLARGADLNWIPPWSPQTPLEMASVSNPGRPPATDLVKWLQSKGARTSHELK